MTDTIDEAGRQFTLCNACRYCEGYCAVWPAMERRSRFDEEAVAYLANLCYNCRDCYYACPYIPPHEFAINIPKILSDVRLKVYEEYARPRIISPLFETRKRYSILITASSVIVMMLFALVAGDPARLLKPHLQLGSFYDIFPYLSIIIAGTALGIYVLLGFFQGVLRFAARIHGSATGLLNARALWLAANDALKHTWFKGGGAGCTYPESKGSYSFLVLHGMVFYGFASALVATILAAIYQDFLGVLPPYQILSPPVLFGTSGGIAMAIGTLILLYFKAIGDKSPNFKGMADIDYEFLIILNLASVSGMLTLVLRSTSLMGVAFAVHLGLVLSLFVTAPYGKFVHFTYRYISLVKNRLEETLPHKSHHDPKAWRWADTLRFCGIWDSNLIFQWLRQDHSHHRNSTL
jgi:citrate/tricarballylate utilization protein